MRVQLPKSRWALLCLAAAGIVAAAIVVLLVKGPAGSEPSRASPAATPTVAPEIIANTAEDALRLSSSDFTGYGSTLSLAKPEAVSYVKTTVGQAQAMFVPYRPGGWELPEDAPAWAIVAYGEFKSGRPGVVDRTPTPFSAKWIVVVQKTELMRTGASNQRYDLSKLGSVVEVPESVWREYCVPGDRVDPDKCSP